MDIDIELLTNINPPGLLTQKQIVNFIHSNLPGKEEESIDDINSAIEYALSPYPNKGGFVILARNDEGLLGAAIINKTGMKGYMPGNIMTYFAVAGSDNLKKTKEKLIAEATQFAKNDISFHSQPGNPDLKLFKAAGYKKEYVELQYEEDTVS